MTSPAATPRTQTVFLVDDDDDLRFTLALALRDAGFEVREFGTASAAFEAARASTPGALLLDYHVEGMSAETLVASMRANGLGHVPILLLTGSSEVRELARSLGVFDWLAKPFELDALIAHTRAALDAR